MANLVVSVTPEGQHRISQSYFSIGSVVTAEGDRITPRMASLGNALVRSFDGAGFVLRMGDWVHSLPNIAAAGGATGLSLISSGRYSSNSLSSILSVTPEIGDRVEIPTAVAKQFSPRILGGVYRYVSLSPPTIQIVDPPIYTMTTSAEVGGPIYSRPHPRIAGGLEGLNAVAMVMVGTANHTRAGYEIGTPEGFIDFKATTRANALGASYHGVWFNVSRPTAADIGPIIAMAFSASSERQSYDKVAQNASGSVTISTRTNRLGTSVPFMGQHSVDANLKPYNAKFLASSVDGAARYYWRDPAGIDNIGSIHINDDSGSRAIYNEFRAVAAGENSQIKMNDGTIPDPGSIIYIPEVAAKTFYPEIAPGAYTVIKNDNNGPWELGARYDLIVPIGTGPNNSLYVDQSQYSAAFTGTVELTTGSLYQLRVNTTASASSVDYYLQHQGESVILIGRSTNARLNFSVDYIPTVAQFDSSQFATARLWVSIDGAEPLPRFDFRVVYINKGTLSLPAGNNYTVGETMSFTITTDAARRYLGGTYFLVSAATGAVAITGAIPAGLSVNVPLAVAPGAYDITVNLSYRSDGKPSERITQRITIV
jgi:hypothetical protein